MEKLIEKLEQAEVGSRELDREVWLACGQPEKWGGPVNPPGKGVWEGPHVSYSLDAALALAERIMSEDEVLFWLNQVVYRADQDTVNGTVKGLPLKLCAAILRAQSEAR